MIWSKRLKTILPILMLCIASQSVAGVQKKIERSPYTFSLDLLYWQLKEGGADNWAQHISPSGTDQPIKIFDVPFHHRLGFRAGIERQHQNQFWKTKAIFTHYQTSASNHASGNIYSDYLGNFYAGNTSGSSFGPYYDEGSIQWNMTYNTLDLQVSHPFKADDTVMLEPFFGIKSAIINQKIYTQWRNPHSPASVTPPVTYSFTEASEDLKNDYIGIGPSIGINTTWPLLDDEHKKLNIIGNILGAILLGHWRFNDFYQATQFTTPFSSIINSRDFYSAGTMANGLLGIEFKHTSNQQDIFIRLGYEAQVWFNQLQYYSFNMGRTNNLMSLQGITLDLSANFK